MGFSSSSETPQTSASWKILARAWVMLLELMPSQALVLLLCKGKYNIFEEFWAHASSGRPPLHPWIRFTKAGFSFSHLRVTLCWGRLLPCHNAALPSSASLLCYDGPRQLGPTACCRDSVIRDSVPGHHRIIPWSYLFLKCLFPPRYVLFLLYISC